MSPGRLYLAFFATVVGTAIALTVEMNAVTIFLTVVGCLQGLVLGIATICKLIEGPCDGCCELTQQLERSERRRLQSDKALLTLRELQ